MPMKIGMKILAVALVALLTLGCSSSRQSEQVVSDDGWVLKSWAGSPDLAGKVYLQLNENNTFVLYQNIEMFGFKKFTGAYTVEAREQGQCLVGVYDNAVAWESVYLIESRTPKQMTLKSLSDEVVSEYASTVIPAQVKDGVVSTTVRAAAEKPFL